MGVVICGNYSGSDLLNFVLSLRFIPETRNLIGDFQF